MRARILPIFHPGFDQPAPHGGVAVGVKGRTGEIVMGIAITAHHIVGHRAHGGELDIAGQRRVLGLKQVEQAQGFGGKAVGQVEARQVEARRG